MGSTQLPPIVDKYRVKEFLKLILEHEPISHDEILYKWDNRVTDDIPREIIDVDKLDGNELFRELYSFSRGGIIADVYEDGYKYYVTDRGLELFDDLERKQLRPKEEFDNFQYPKHRCDHDDKRSIRENGRAKRQCYTCGKKWV